MRKGLRLLRLAGVLLAFAAAGWVAARGAAASLVPGREIVPETLENVTLRDGTKKAFVDVEGYWYETAGGGRIFVRVDPESGLEVSAFVPSASTETVTSRRYVGDEEREVEDAAQPKRTLEPVEVPVGQHGNMMFPTGKIGWFGGGGEYWMMPLKWREITVVDGKGSVVERSGEFTSPWGISYPFDDRPLSEEWRTVAICLRNPNPWHVVSRVESPAGDFPSVLFGPGEEKWLRFLLPEKMSYYKKRRSSDCWEDDGGKPVRLNYMISQDQVNVTTEIAENLDPKAPARYRTDPPSDDDPRAAVWGHYPFAGLEIARACDVADWEGAWPERKELREEGRWAYVWRLVPAFKRTLRWVPDPDFGDPWGRLEFDAVPGWAWEWDVLYPPSNVSWDRWDPYMRAAGARYLGADGTDEYWLFEFASDNDGRNSDPCVFSISSIDVLPRGDVRDWKHRLDWYRRKRLDVPQRPSVRLAPGQSGRLWAVVKESLVPEYSWYGWVKGYRLEYTVVDAGGPERSFDASRLTTADKEKLKKEKKDKVNAGTFEDDLAARTYGWEFSFKGRAAAAVYGHFSPDGYGLVVSGEYGGFAGPVAVPESYVDDARIVTADDLAEMISWAQWGDLRNNAALLLNAAEDDGKPGVTFGAAGGWGGWDDGGGA